MAFTYTKDIFNKGEVEICCTPCNSAENGKTKMILGKLTS
jgi:hypothetical protein